MLFIDCFEGLSEQIRIEEQEILRESDNKVDDAQTSEALESSRSKIPAKKPRGRSVKERKAKPKTKRLWSDDETLLLIKYWEIKDRYTTLNLRNTILKVH